MPTQITELLGVARVPKEGCACAVVGTVFRVWEVLPQDQMTLQVMCGTAHGEVGCLSSGTHTGRLGSSRSCPVASCQPRGAAPGSSGAALGAVHPSAQRSGGERGSWDTPVARDSRPVRPVGRGILPLRCWEPSQLVVLTVSVEDTAACSPARGRESQC